MRAGWEGNNELQRRVLQEPTDARIIVEAQTVAHETTARRKDQWNDADSTTGLTLGSDGSVRISGSLDTLFDHNTSTDAVITDMARPPQDNSIFCARIEWRDTNADPDQPIERIKAFLDPDVDGNGAEVSEWRCQLFGAESVPSAQPTPSESLDIRLVPLIGAVKVDAGPSAAEVTFDVGTIPLRRIQAAGHDWPRTYIIIWGVASDGSLAANVAWRGDSSTTTHTTTAGDVLTQVRLSSATSEFGGYNDLGVQSAGVPYLVIESASFTEQTITFSGNPFDLGSVPTGTVEFAGVGETPGGSSITYEIRNDADTAWVEFNDGDTTDDLDGVGKRQSYEMRATLTPNTTADVSPIVRAIGAKEVTRINLDGLATVGGIRWAVDPISLKGEITEAQITLLREGLRDFRDPVSELLSEHNLADLDFRLWIGYGEEGSYDTRKNWLLIDTFGVDDHDDTNIGVVLTCLSRLVKLRRALPKYDTANDQRAKLEYTNQTLAAVYADLLDGQIALPARLRGPGVESADAVTKEIEDSDGKTEVDAIAYLANGAVISSQGVVKFVPMFDNDPVKALFPAEEVNPLAIGPGASYASPEFFVPWNYDFENGRFREEARSFNVDSLAAFDQDGLDGPKTLDEAVARWIDTEDHAQAIGDRHVETFGSGLILWSFHSNTPHPELEPGDKIAVATDRFIAKDPHAAEFLRGHLWAIGVVQEVRDAWGRELTVWIQSYADILSSSEAADRLGFAKPKVINVTPRFDSSGNLFVTVTGSDANFAAAAVSDSAFPTETTVDAAFAFELNAANSVEIDTETTFTAGETAFISVKAYERNDGTGSESAVFQTKATFTGVSTLAPTIQVKSNQVGSTGNLTLVITDPAELLTRVLFKTHSGAGDVDLSDPTDGTWTEDPTAPYEASVTLSAKHTSVIGYAVGYTDSDENEVFIQGSREFDLDRQAEVFDIGCEFNSTVAVITAHFDEDAVANGTDPSGYVTVGVNSDPADPTAGANDGVITLASNVRTGTVTTSVIVLPGSTAHVKVVGVDSAGNLGKVAGPKNFLNPDASGVTLPEVGDFVGSWTHIYQNVSNASPATLTDANGDALDVADEINYVLQAKNLDSTGGEVRYATLRTDGSAWTIGSDFGGGSSNDRPDFFIDAGVPKVRLAGGSNVHDVEVNFEAARTLLPHESPQDNDGKFVIDFPNALLTVKDEQSTPVDRVYLGKLPSTGYGIEIYDASGDLILGATGLGFSVVNEAQLADGAVSTVKLGDASVSTEKIAGGAVTTAKIGAAQVTTEKIGDEAITTAKIGDSQVVTTKIGDEAITQVKMGSGLFVPEIVATLPTLPDADYPQGATVVLTTDDKLYRSTGSEWTVAVPTVDLTGEIATAQIEDAAISSAKIATDAIIEAKLADAAVTTAKLADSSVLEGKLADAAVATAKIADNAVEQAKIANYAIGGNKIDGMARGQHGVFLDTFEQSPGSWDTNGGGSFTHVSSADAQTGGHVLQVDSADDLRLTFPENIPFDASKLYRMRVRARGALTGDAANQRFYAGVHGIAQDGTTLVNQNGADSISSQHYVAVQAEDLANETDWQTFTGWVQGWGATGAENIGGNSPTNPAKLHPDVRYIRPMFIANYQNAADGNRTEIDYIAIDVFDEDSQVRTYSGLNVDGVVAADKVVTDSIAAGAITAAKIQAGAITASEIAAGTITSQEIASNTIATSNLIVGSFDNLVQNPGAENSLSSFAPWVVGSVVAGDGWAVSTTPLLAAARSGSNCFVYQWPGDTTGTSRLDSGDLSELGTLTAAAEGDQFYLEAWARKTGAFASPDVGVTIIFLDEPLHSVGGDQTIIAPTTSYQKMSVTATAPAGTAAVAFALLVSVEASESLTVSFDDVYARRMVAGDIVVDGTITAAKIEAGTITSNEIASNTITAAEIAADTITADEIASNTITANKIAANAITASEIAANTITAANIAAGAIGASEIAADAVIASKIAADAVVANAIASNAVTANAIAANAVTAAKINVSQLDAIAADVGTITAGWMGNASPASATAAIRLAGATALPATKYIDFTATDSPFMAHPQITLWAFDQSVPKKLIFHAAESVPATSSTVWSVSGRVSIAPGQTGAGLQQYMIPLVMPNGIVITQVRARLFRETSSETARVKLFRYTAETGTPTTLSTLNATTNSSWHWVSDNLNHEIAEEDAYVFQIELNANSQGAGFGAQAGRIEVFYEMDNYGKTY